MLQKVNKLNWWDKMMMAATFAEAGEPETAKEVMRKQRPRMRTRKEAARRPELRV